MSVYAVINFLILVAGLVFAVYILWLGLFRRDTLRARMGPLAVCFGALMTARIVIDVTLF